ncbi:MAG: hypothetical protein ACKPKO_16770, partial [Candidatus Fonsibacter sp.]
APVDALCADVIPIVIEAKAHAVGVVRLCELGGEAVATRVATALCAQVGKVNDLDGATVALVGEVVVDVAGVCVFVPPSLATS